MFNLRTLAVALALLWAGATAFSQSDPLTPRPAGSFPLVLHTPREAVDFASWDIQHQPSEALDNVYYRYRFRYLSLYNIPEEDLDTYRRLIDGVLNFLNASQNRLIGHVEPVEFTDSRLLRLDLSRYSGSRYSEPHDPRDLDNFIAAWDSLAFNGSGPVVSKKKIVVNGEDVFKVRNGEPYFYIIAKEGENGKKIPIVNPRLNQDAMLFLQRETHTFFPILRADWFISYALLAPAYYKFLKIKTLKDTEDISLKDNRASFMSNVGAVSHSKEVALHNRAGRETPASTGDYWETDDYLTNIDDDDILDNLELDRRDATEIIGSMPNRMNLYALFDGNDKLLDVPDPGIAIAKDTPWEDKQVWNALACIACHDEGFKNIKDNVRPLVQPPSALLFNTDGHGHSRYDPGKREKIIQAFSVPIEQSINKSKQRYAEAIFAATGGWTPRQFSQELFRAFLHYYQDDLTLEDMAIESGHFPDVLRAAIGRTVGQRHEDVEAFMGQLVLRDQWEHKGYRATILMDFKGLKSKMKGQRR